MNDSLLDFIVTIGSKYHFDTVDLLAKRIALLKDMQDFHTVVSALEKWMEVTDLEKLQSLCHTKKNLLSPLECAAAMRASAITAGKIKDNENIEMVWTGPSTSLVPTRHTAQALVEVIDASRKKLFIVSYVAYKIDSIMKALENAMQRGVKIEILLESSVEHGGKVSIDSIKLFKRSLPDANIYMWDDKPVEENGFTGSVHAKCAVCDNHFAFITSANLTQAALEHNMELGVLVRGGDIPDRLHKHLSALVTTETIQVVD